MEKINVALIVGSARKESINLKLSKAIERAGSAKFTFSRIPIEPLVMFNQDLETNLPPEVAAFKKSIEEAQAIIIVSPEYNRSVPPLTKNAIDWGSRPMGKNSWAGKKIGLIGASPGAQGTVSCQLLLRQMFGTLDAHVMGKPEAYVTFNPPTVIDDSGNVNDPKIEKLLENFIAAFAKHTSA